MHISSTGIKILICSGLCLTLIAAFWFVYKAQDPVEDRSSLTAEVKSRVKESKAEKSANNSFPMPTQAGKNAQKKDIRPAVDADKKPDWAQAAMEALKSQNVGLRVKAAMDLRNQFSPEAVELLEMFLNDSDPAVVAEALDSLGFIGLNSELNDMVFEILAEKARDHNFRARGNALMTAARMGKGDEVLPIIADCIKEDTPESESIAIRAMAFVASKECIPHIVEVLERDPDSEVLRDSFNLLAKINTPESINILVDNLRAEDPQRRKYAVWALTRKADDDDLKERLTLAVANQELDKDVLGVIASSPMAADIFGEVLQSEEIEKEDKIDMLEALADNSIKAPGHIRNKMAKELLVLLQSNDPDLEVAALEAISDMGAQEDLSDELAELLESDDFLVQQAALKAFIQYCTPDTYKPLKKLWYHKEEQMRRTAFFFSEAFLNHSDIPDLEKASNHSDEFIAKHSKMMLRYLTQ